MAVGEVARQVGDAGDAACGKVHDDPVGLEAQRVGGNEAEGGGGVAGSGDERGLGVANTNVFPFLEAPLVPASPPG